MLDDLLVCVLAKRTFGKKHNDVALRATFNQAPDQTGRLSLSPMIITIICFCGDDNT